MKKTLTTAVIVFAALVQAQTQTPPAHYWQSGDLATALSTSLAERGGMGVGRVANGSDFRINLIKRTAPGGAIVHDVGTELHFITEGAGVLLTGGSIVRPERGGSAIIEGGLAQRVTVGDAVLIPVGTPHQYTSVEGSVSYLEVRFNTEDYE